MPANVKIPVIEKLNFSNYADWSPDIKFQLAERDAQGIVKGIEVRPEAEPENASVIRDFDKRSNAALFCIYQHLSGEFKSLIGECDDPKIAWQMLKDNLIPDSRSEHMMLFLKFLECHMNPGESMQSYFTRLKDALDQLFKMGKPMDETYSYYQLLRKMPEKFQPIIQFLL